ncbi:MAG: glycogen/starch/alpha-glucan family phosphorylase, partial [Aphanocapsa feldmannii 277cI]
AIAVAELMRLLIDERQLTWDAAWDITSRSFAYTNHTLLPEALEKWGLPLFASLLPRHLELIYEINRRFLQQVRLKYPGDERVLASLSIIDEEGHKSVRMAHLATVGSHHVNGVAALHSELVKTSLMPEFAELWPDKFTNVTNGVTPRRWLGLANPVLRNLLDESIGDGWIRHLDQLRRLEDFSEDQGFLDRWQQAKLEVKRQLAGYIHNHTGILVDPASMFDVQVKRIHEYKRQHLNALQVIVQYLRIKEGMATGMAPRTVVFGGKAAPGYYMAKLIIRFLNGIAETINSDPDMDGRLRVVFLPDYNVKLGQRVYPGTDLSEQISTAGKEASGTGNMKFAMNGALTIGTLDGANVEIRDAVGAENFFLFGKTTEQIAALRYSGYRPWEVADQDPLLSQALKLVEQGHFSSGDWDLFQPLLDNLRSHDSFFVFADFASYLQVQDEVSKAWTDRRNWNRMSVLNTARTGFFSSDRSIQEYCDQIWKAQPFPINISCKVSSTEQLDLSKGQTHAAM